MYNSPAQALGDTLRLTRTLTPTHVVFNGAVGALTGANALKATVGERVLFLHSQANRDSRPHLIGGHGDLVWNGGTFSDASATNLETWFIPGGTAVSGKFNLKKVADMGTMNMTIQSLAHQCRGFRGKCET